MNEPAAPHVMTLPAVTTLVNNDTLTPPGDKRGLMLSGHDRFLDFIVFRENHSAVDPRRCGVIAANSSKRKGD